MSDIVTNSNPIPRGLTNEGTVCYVNSLLQQFYHCRQFRQFILALNELNCQQDPFLDCLKRLFYDLSDGSEETVEIEYFIENWNDFSKYYIDYDEQRDISEFLRWFFIQLTQSFQRIAQETVLRDLFCHEVIYHTYVNSDNLDDTLQSILISSSIERKDKITYLLLNVSEDILTLEGSLRDYTKREEVHFNWAVVDQEKKISYPTCKQTKITSLGRYLIIQLKRFEFNTKKCKVKKRNDRLEFPLQLDMFPYVTSQEIEQDGVIYNLQGVVIHQGKANKGHYYSLCREGVSDTWYRLDDEDVSVFDINSLSQFAYGGKDLEEEEMEKGNAFLLFYTAAAAERR